MYTAAPAGGGCEGGFPPSTVVGPNLAFGVQRRLSTSPSGPRRFTDCAASVGDEPDDARRQRRVRRATTSSSTPVDPGTIDPIDKAWDLDLINARSQTQVGATLSWSTAGYTGLGARWRSPTRQDPDATPLPASVYDTFDLVRIDPITAARRPAC